MGFIIQKLRKFLLVYDVLKIYKLIVYIVYKMIKNIIAFLSGVYIAQEYNIPRLSVKVKEMYENIILKHKKEE